MVRILKDTDKNFQSIKRVFTNLSNTRIQVGWIEGKKEMRKEHGTTNAEVANHLLVGNLKTGQPPRNFFKRLLDIRLIFYQSIVENIIKNIFDTRINKYFVKGTAQDYKNIILKAFKKLAEVAKADLKNELINNGHYYAPNTDSTIKSWRRKFKNRKNATKKVFINTTQLVNSITYKIFKK